MLKCAIWVWAIVFGAAAPIWAFADESGFIATWTNGSLEGFENPTGDISVVRDGSHPGGYLKASREGGHNVIVIPKGFLREGWTTLFGTEKGTISFDVKALDNYTIPEVCFTLSDGVHVFRHFISTQNVLSHEQTQADGWVHFEIPWCANWTDAEAIAHGWRPYTGESDHWTSVMTDPSHSDLTIVGGTGKGDQVIGLDNFRDEGGKVLDAKARRLIANPTAPAQPIEKNPVLSYGFEERTGELLRDASGKKNNGKIVGAKWVQLGRKWALEFDGVDDYVDCGAPEALNLHDALTLEAWVYAEPIYSVWLTVPILGNNSYQFNQKVHDVTARAAGHALGFLPFRKWVHVAQAWDGQEMRFYVDGTLASRVKAPGPLGSGGNFLMAGPRTPESTDPPEYNRRFKGKIASVAVYNRALSQEEILEDLRSSNITGSVFAMPIPQPGLGQLKVELDAARLSKALSGVEVTLELVKAGTKAPALVSTRVTKFDWLGRAVVDLKVPRLERGNYVVRISAKDSAGKAVGLTSEGPVAWSGSASFPSGPEGARKLNNLVTELLAVPGPVESGAARTFVNPRAGFIYISNRGAKAVTIKPAGDGAAIELALSEDYGDAAETQCYLPKGQYTLVTASMKELVVRAVSQTMYDYAYTEGSDSVSYGIYAGESEERYVFPHTNTFLVHDFNADRPFAEAWKAKGRRMLSSVTTGLKPKEGQSNVDAACDVLSGDVGFNRPLYSGLMIDEFANSDPALLIWSQALERLRADPRFAKKVVHAWNYALFDLVTYKGGADGRQFAQSLQKHESPIQWECYVDYQRTEIHALHHINDKLVGEARTAEQALPGLLTNVIVVPCSYVTGGPPWITMTLPNVDSRTFLEMQIRTVATDPTFAGVRGLGVYRSCYSDEETVRWAARLFRHYAIEGHTEPLGKDPYLLTHVTNPEFEDRGSGWNLSPAEKDSIRFDIYPHFGTLQGRYPSPTQGDTVIVTRRSPKGPNVFSQVIINLEPGRLYSFRMCSADFKDMPAKEKQALRIGFQNVEMLPEKCFTSIARARATDKFLNWHVRVFRAKSNTATLSVSDWGSDTEPGGTAGQELMFNFIKVQPYWSE